MTGDSAGDRAGGDWPADDQDIGSPPAHGGHPQSPQPHPAQHAGPQLGRPMPPQGAPGSQRAAPQGPPPGAPRGGPEGLRPPQRGAQRPPQSPQQPPPGPPVPPAPTVATPRRIEPQRQRPHQHGEQHPGPQQDPRHAPYQDADPYADYDWPDYPEQDYSWQGYGTAPGAGDYGTGPETGRGYGAESGAPETAPGVREYDAAHEPGPPGHPADPESQGRAPARRRGKKPLVITLVLLLLLGLGGGTLAVPDVANRLALPWAPNAPKEPPPEPFAVRLSIMGPEQAVGAPSSSGVAAALERAASSSALGTLSGSVIDPVTGAVLWERDAGKPLPPASTTKLLTASAALLSIDHTATLSTKVVKGPEPGSVVLVAGGDPTLSAAGKGDETLYSGAARLDDLVKQVRNDAPDVRTVYLDTSTYQGGTRAPGWEPGDAPSTYAAPIEPVMLDGGRSDPSNDDVPRTGDPAGTLAEEFAERLGAKVGGSAKTARDATVLGEVHSAPLPVLVDDLLTASDNVLAEAVARQVALANGKPPSFSGAAAATKQVLGDAGFDVSEVTLADGSGLSSDNAIPATLLSEILAAAAGDGTAPQAAKLRPLLAGLPVAGGTGTLVDRYREGGASGKGWVRAKTGTLSGVNTLAGVVLTKEGRLLVFALMSSGTGPNSARPALDAVAGALRGCGCR